MGVVRGDIKMASLFNPSYHKYISDIYDIGVHIHTSKAWFTVHTLHGHSNRYCALRKIRMWLYSHVSDAVIQKKTFLAVCSGKILWSQCTQCAVRVLTSLRCMHCEPGVTFTQ